MGWVQRGFQAGSGAEVLDSADDAPAGAGTSNDLVGGTKRPVSVREWKEVQALLHEKVLAQKIDAGFR